MKEYLQHQVATQSAGRALIAIEDQLSARRQSESSDVAQKRKDFFVLLDNHREQLFSAIEQAVKQNKRVFHPATIPGFAACCDKIFDIGAGRYSYEILNEWFYASDLKHIFHAEPGGVISW